jgi:hypothetical protein
VGDKWEIEPNGVAKVLKTVDSSGEDLETASSSFDDAKSSGASLLTADDRGTLSSAWETFCKDRAEVPGKLMWVLNERSSEVSAAVLDINTGSVNMTENVEKNRKIASEEWSIHGTGDYADN